MGSFNSTRWNGYRKKRLVESCLSIDVNWLVLDVIGRDNLLYPDHLEIEAIWYDQTSGRRGHADVVIDTYGPLPLVGFYFAVPGRSGRLTARLFADEVRLTSTPAGFGGQRWWFECPKCRDRVVKLYQQPDDYGLACRRCLGLTYRSCQTSHMKSISERIDSIAKWVGKLRRG